MIDTHHHLWKYAAAEYGWIGKGMDVLKQDFLPPDLKREMDASGVTGAVAVQARQTLQETEWLLDLASKHAYMLGVVGWAPLIDPKVGGVLERFAKHPKCKGMRHVLHDEADDNYMLRADFQHGVAALRPFGLVYDILIFEKHLPQTIKFVDSHPNQVFVVDHIAKPRIRDGMMSPWRENIRELAKRPNVHCKVSGMATEADHGKWTPAQLKPYYDVVLEAFTPRRLMFGTDWPVLRLAGTYPKWAALVKEWIAPLSASEQEQIRTATAKRVYRL